MIYGEGENNGEKKKEGRHVDDGKNNDDTRDDDDDEQQRSRRCTRLRFCCGVFLFLLGGFLMYLFLFRETDDESQSSGSSSSSSSSSSLLVLNEGNVTGGVTGDCQESVVHVTASGFRNDKGQAVLWLHTSRAQWNKDKDDWDDFRDVYYHAAQDGLREGGNITFEVTVDSDNIDRYIGAFILHDEDENDKMKTNWVGMPKEGCGASNGASGGPSGGPSWGDAKVFLGICQLLNIEFELWYS